MLLREMAVPEAKDGGVPHGVVVTSGSAIGRSRMAGPLWAVDGSLLHLGLDSRGPPVASAQAPPDLGDPRPSQDGADPVHAG
jgi:hypothetical protein